MDRAVRDLIDSCYNKATGSLSASREDMDKVVAYLLEKETITGAEMVAIIEGRDPALVEDPYASTQSGPQGGDIEPPARSIHITSQPVVPPPGPSEEAGSPPPAGPEDGPTPAE